MTPGVSSGASCDMTLNVLPQNSTLSKFCVLFLHYKCLFSWGGPGPPWWQWKRTTTVGDVNDPSHFSTDLLPSLRSLAQSWRLPLNREHVRKTLVHERTAFLSTDSSHGRRGTNRFAGATKPPQGLSRILALCLLSPALSVCVLHPLYKLPPDFSPSPKRSWLVCP